VLIVAQSVLGIQYSTASERTKVNPEEALIAAITKCKNLDQLDCIDSVTIIGVDGKRFTANQIDSPTDFELDVNQQRVEEGASAWEYLDSSGVKNSFIIDATLTTPKFIVAGGLDDIEVPKGGEEVSEPAPDSESDEEKLIDTEKVSVDTRFYEPKLTISALFGKNNSLPESKKLNPGERLEVAVRMSWLLAEEVYLPGKDATFEIGSSVNGRKFTLTGSEMQIYERQSSRNRLTGQVTYTTIVRDEFEFLVIHPKPEAERAKCHENGVKLIASNASSLAMADENTNSSLKFTASSYPYKPDNTLISGFAKIKVPVAWISCKFPNSDLRYASEISVSVSTTDGSKIVQKPSIQAKILNGLIDVLVENFYFAKTEILIQANESQIASAKSKDVADKAEAEANAKAEAEAKAAAERAAAELKAKQEAEAAAAAVAAKSKKSTITCLKGKLTKKVTAVNPRCPKGYKKK